MKDLHQTDDSGRIILTSSTAVAKGGHMSASIKLSDGRIVTTDWLRCVDGQNELRLMREVGERPLCLCKPNQIEHPFLQIKLLPSNILILARMPNTQSQHDPSCRNGQHHSHGTDKSQSIVESYIENDDGTFEVNSFFSLEKTIKDVALEKVGGEDKQIHNYQGKNTSTLLGLLHILWDKAEQNKHFPSSDGKLRNWNTTAYFIKKTLQRGRIKGKAMSSVIFINQWSKDEKHSKDYWNWSRGLADQNKEGVVGVLIGRVADLHQAAPTGALELRLDLIPTYIKLGEAASRDLRTSYPRIIDKLQSTPSSKDRDFAVVGIFLVTNSTRIDNNGQTKKCLIARKAALMMTSKDYIPVESDYELQMANALRDANRRYIKPIRHDSDSPVFPDFIIIDEKPATYIEVFGITNDQHYEKRKQEKLAYYQRAKKQLIAWNASDNEPMPTIPMRQPPEPKQT